MVIENLRCDLCGRAVHPMRATRWGKGIPPEYLCPACVPFATRLFYVPVTSALFVVGAALWTLSFWLGIEYGPGVVAALVIGTYIGVRALIWRGRPRRER